MQVCVCVSVCVCVCLRVCVSLCVRVRMCVYVGGWGFWTKDNQRSKFSGLISAAGASQIPPGSTTGCTGPFGDIVAVMTVLGATVSRQLTKRGSPLCTEHTAQPEAWLPLFHRRSSCARWSFLCCIFSFLKLDPFVECLGQRELMVVPDHTCTHTTHTHTPTHTHAHMHTRTYTHALARLE